MTTDPRRDGCNIRITFTPDYFEALQAMARSRIDMCLSKEEPPRESDKRIANLNPSKPFLKVSSPAVAQSLSQRLADFHQATGRDVTEIAMTLPAEVAEDFISDRERLGNIAGKLAGAMSQEAEIFTQFTGIVDTEETNPDDWLKGLTLEEDFGAD